MEVKSTPKSLPFGAISLLIRGLIYLPLALYDQNGKSSIMACSLWLELFILSAIVVLIISPKITAQQPTYRYHMCTNTSTFTPNSAFSKNLNATLSSLLSNATISNGFYNTSSGALQGPDAANGLFLCRGDISPSLCQTCVQASCEDIITRCPNQKEAIIWYYDCMLRYSNRSIFADMEERPTVSLGNIYNTSNPSQFTRTWAYLIGRLVNKAVGSSKFFATEYVNFSNFTRVFGLVQCTPDIVSVDCGTCLDNCFSEIPSFCNENLGCSVYMPSCNIRFESYLFYNDSSQLLPSPPTNATPRPSPSPPLPPAMLTNSGGGNEFLAVESLQLDLHSIIAATCNFSEGNKIGEGGFGSVYKGTLHDGQMVAIKRLSESSRQGLKEFRNEVAVVAKLQHRNLVRLLEFCAEEEEKILVYEFVPNKSLDYFLFDQEKQGQLDWLMRCKIIRGIARGLLYLHEDSRLRIIHRDLKASNVLLYEDMNPKIADFGMARICGVNQSRGNTTRIVGTYGYMSPEYALLGEFSIKSDVYSYGVLILEIISGKKNSSFYQSDCAEGILSYAWRLWTDGRPLELTDQALGKSFHQNEVTRYIHVGLLCVQEDPADRPMIGTVLHMLTSFSVTLPIPKRPAFCVRSRTVRSSKAMPSSVNEASITELYPR
ncbi:cysteine-rich receptor-like protein kinase 10 [Mangifera indica]|uniref:cysteine-rich receptor-like protein kinase 10 n=1 Tax=Mangifera indica TaxID=29780 RepID=UPI001CFA2DCC|nr:cysteine-rich receptor-like protein kinase 10 [Mangifera indica]